MAAFKRIVNMARDKKPNPDAQIEGQKGGLPVTPPRFVSRYDTKGNGPVVQEKDKTACIYNYEPEGTYSGDKDRY